MTGERAPRDPRLWLALTTLYVAWGSTYLAIRVMVETVPPLLGAAMRFLAAAAILAVALIALGGTQRLRVGRRPALARPRSGP
jgi:drug/metabolite transporter (DMT)-like permease